MRTIRKRLVCVNRNNHDKNRCAIGKIQERYLSKMAAKGWELYEDGQITEGNSMFYWERYITIVKK